ncbi:34166_t:CDS:2, partial [Gigaspora margarita]
MKSIVTHSHIITSISLQPTTKSLTTYERFHQLALTTSNFGSSSLPNNASLIRVSLQQYEEELEELPINAINESFKTTLVSNIISKKNIITKQKTQLKKLKQHAQAQAKLESKKAKMLKEDIVEKYDGPRRLLAAMIHPNFWDKIHDCIEFGSMYQKRKKVVIKMKPHIDKYYCLASVKTAQTLAKVFVDDAIIISQDDKTKVNLGVLAVGRTFKTIQTINEPILVADHNFLVSSKIKLIPSVYLVIDLANSNDSLHLAIIKENKVKPVWVLLVD